MQSIRCRCGKIVCQLENVPDPPRVEVTDRPYEGPAAVILCRHCKSYVVLHLPTITAVNYSTAAPHLESDRFAHSSM
jgi:hypothetical protein